jgi:AraC-like DNA-binding protein
MCRFSFPGSPQSVSVMSENGTAPGRRRPATQEAYGSIFDEAVAILASEFPRPVRVDDVARRVATSPRQLQRVFAEVSGLGFRSFLRHVRMCHAAHLLSSSDLPVKEIARRVGYRDASQFSKAFKRAYGVTPSQSRAGGAGKLTHCTKPQTVNRLPLRVPVFGPEEVSARWVRS